MSEESHHLPLEQRAVSALFAIAARDGWTRTTLAAIAAESGVGPAELKARFVTREAILDRFILETDREVIDGTLPRAEGETIRDRLFDIVMRRIDAAQRHRAGVLAVRRALRRDPLAALGYLPVMQASARWMLDAAGVSTAGLLGLLRINALLVLLVPVAQAWESDDSADLAKTMAELDRALTRAEEAEGWAARLPMAG
jgi:AcrR family transcriptional regulator